MISRLVAIATAAMLAASCASPAAKSPGKGSNNGTNGSNNGTNASNNGTNASNNGTVPLGACTNATPIPDGAKTCRTNDDCAATPDTPTCAYGPNTGDGCGLGIACSTCTQDSDCADGNVCQTMSDPCCGPDAARCNPACTAGSCPAGEMCGTDGHCTPQSCNDTYQCPDGEVCDPTRTGGAPVDAHGCTPADCVMDGADCPDGTTCDPSSSVVTHCVPVSCSDGYQCPPNQDCKPNGNIGHGCVVRTCTDDSQCDCGACVSGICQPRLFYCQALAIPG